MKIIGQEDLPNIESYPLFFQHNYAQYETSRGWKVILLADEYGAVIPLKTRKSRFVKRAQYLYPPVKDGKHLSPDSEKMFLENLLLFCKRESVCDFIMPPLHFSLFQSVPAGSYYTDLGIITVDLQKTEEEIFKSFSENYRNEIRKAVAGGVKINFDNSRFGDFYSLYKQTHQKQNIYYDPLRDEENMVVQLGEQNCSVVIAEKENDLYGAALILFSGEEAYYFQSGAAEDCPFPGANKLLQHEIMKRLRKQGIRRYCMGGYRLGNVSGTKYDGIQKFKLRFGGMVEKGYLFYSTITWKYILYKFMLNIYLILRGVRQNTTGLNYRAIKK